MRFITFLMAAFMAAMGLAGCGLGSPKAGEQTAGDFSGKLSLTGSTTVAPLATEIGKRFTKKYPNVKVDVQMGGSGKGIADATNGTADIGMISKELKEEEKKALKSVAIAKDGICMIVHKDNPVKELTDEQVVAIYTGKITNWKEVGGNDTPITVVNKAEGRGTLDAFTHYFKLKNPDIKASEIIGDNEQGIKTVAGKPDAIGYVSIGSAEASAGDGVTIKLLPSKGIAPTSANVGNGTFPMSRTLNLVVKHEVAPMAQAFIDFCLLPENHDLVKGLYFVPVK